MSDLNATQSVGLNSSISNGTEDLSGGLGGDRERIYKTPLKYIAEKFKLMINSKEEVISEQMELINSQLENMSDIQQKMATVYAKYISRVDSGKPSTKTPIDDSDPDIKFLKDNVPGLEEYMSAKGGQFNYFDIQGMQQFVDAHTSKLQNDIDSKNQKVNRELQKMDSIKQNYIDLIKSEVNIILK
ncbi:hypothetical protein ACNO7T_22895 [Vibrio campbellii]